MKRTHRALSAALAVVLASSLCTIPAYAVESDAEPAPPGRVQADETAPNQSPEADHGPGSEVPDASGTAEASGSESQTRTENTTEPTTSPLQAENASRSAVAPPAGELRVTLTEGRPAATAGTVYEVALADSDGVQVGAQQLNLSLQGDSWSVARSDGLADGSYTPSVRAPGIAPYSQKIDVKGDPSAVELYVGDLAADPQAPARLGLPVPGELLRGGVNLLGAIIILALFWFVFLNAGSLFGLQYLMMGSIVIGCLAIMRRSWAHIDLSLTRDQRLSYTREFSDYSMPLFVQALLSALALSAERWVLRWFDGSTRQGYFALSQRVSAACFLFVSAMTPLIMRELAIAWGKDDREHMGHLLTRFAPLLFGIAAWFSCFTAVEASVLVHIFGGAEFAAALVPVQIMALYPAHQAYGQLASSVFHATGKTKVLRNLAFIEHFRGFLLVWLLVAPQDMLGMGLGATGLALKTVTTQFIMVNLLFWMASRLIPLNFFRNLMLQGLILGSLLGIAWVCKQATGI